MYILFTFLSALFLGCYQVFKKASLKKSSVIETLFFYCFIGFIFSLCFSNIHFFDVTWTQVGLFFLKSVILVVNWLVVLIANKKLDVAVSSAFSMLTTAFVLVESFFLFNEKITIFHILSVVLMTIGIVLMTYLTRDKTKKTKSNYVYIILLIIGAILGSFSATLDKYLINYQNANRANMLSWYLLFNSIIYGILYLINNHKLDFKKLIKNPYLILSGVGIVLADITYFYALGLPNGDLSIISIIRKLNVIISTIMASLILKEKNLLIKILLLFFMIFAVSLPIIFN